MSSYNASKIELFHIIYKLRQVIRWSPKRDATGWHYIWLIVKFLSDKLFRGIFLEFHENIFIEYFWFFKTTNLLIWILSSTEWRVCALTLTYKPILAGRVTINLAIVHCLVCISLSSLYSALCVHSLWGARAVFVSCATWVSHSHKHCMNNLRLLVYSQG